MFSYALLVLFMEVYFLFREMPEDFSRDLFSFSVISFFFFYSVLEHVFSIFAGKLPAAFFSVLPSALLFVLLNDFELLPYLGIASLLAAALRLVFSHLPFCQKIIVLGSFVLEAAAIALCLALDCFKGGEKSSLLMFVFLSVLVLSALVELIVEKSKNSYPFMLFLILAVILTFIPVKTEPIDWSIVAKAGERIADRMGDIYNSVTYYFADLFNDDEYTTGYSSLDVTGESVGKSYKTQLLLSTYERPYFVFEDPETKEMMKRKRTMYLAGGRGVGKEELVEYLDFLYSNGVTKEYAELFSRTSKLNVEYVFLKTGDVIAPSNSYEIFQGTKRIYEGTSEQIHKKGYSITSQYIDIDYGSVYLTSLMRRSAAGKTFSYEEACSYAFELYGIDLRDSVSEEEFYRIIAGMDETRSANSQAALLAESSVKGASARMKELAQTLTGSYNNDYDKCKAIESYLRQYTYSYSVSEGKSRGEGMSTYEGMDKIAESFLFESGKGYCVHYTSAMVTLLRLSGIPARAVSGYRYVFPFEAQDSYKVSGNCAHTWPEAYIENVGWVPFEPTSAYLAAENRTWNKVMKVRSEAEETPSEIEQQPEITDYGVVDVPDFEEEEEEVDTQKLLTLKIAGVVLPVVLSVVFLLLLLILGAFLIRELSYKNASPDQKLRTDVEQIKKYIRKYSKEEFYDRGFLSDYTLRVPQDLRADSEAVFSLYYRLLYADREGFEVTDADNLRAKRLREAVKKSFTRRNDSKNGA